MMYRSTKKISLGSCCFRQPLATSHCRFLHGYNLTAKFWFEADKLDENGWVVDFGSFSKVKKLLEKQFDHTLVVRRNDPLLDEFKELSKKDGCDLRIMDEVGIEAFAKYCYEQMNSYIMSQVGRKCFKVEVWEHNKNSAIYEVG